LRRRVWEREVLLGFAIEIYNLQVAAGRHFLHEHPATAASWQKPAMKELMAHPKVSSVVTHLCMYGHTTRTRKGTMAPVKKATRFASSAGEVLKALGRRCDGNHQHEVLTGGSRVRNSAIYPPGLCRAIVQGIESQYLVEGVAVPKFVANQLDKGCGVYNLEEEKGLLAMNEEKMELDEDAAQEELEHESEGMKRVQPAVYDEVTGVPLPPSLVRAARKEELDFMHNWHVWDVVPISQSWSRLGKAPLGGRWVDVNKGDGGSPLVRSRDVAKGFGPGQKRRLLRRHASLGGASPPIVMGGVREDLGPARAKSPSGGCAQGALACNGQEGDLCGPPS
jgi:hypothetical protein